MRSSELQTGSKIDGGLNESIMVFEVVVEAKVLGDKAELRFGDVAALTAVVERKLELGKAVQQLAGNLMEEDCAFTIELGCNSEGGPPRK